MLLRLVNTPRYQTEFKFHPTRKWRFDYAWPERKVAIEFHGKVWRQGGHTRGSGFIKDREKMNEAIMHGWKVLEITQEHIDSGLAEKWIRELLNDDRP